MMDTEVNENFGIKEVESIKLIKNTKGYNWEIKIIGLDVDKLDKIRLALEAKYG